VHSNSFYGSQAWGLVHFLLDDKNGANRAAVGKFISLLAKKVPQEQAFKEAFGYDYMSAEQGLEKYIAKNVYSSIPVTIGNKPVFDTGAAAAVVSDAEANSYLGELLYQSNETADAEKYLRIALGIDANSARANVSLGLLKAKLHSYAEAQTYAEKAIAAAKDDPYVYYSYAYILSRGSTDEFNYVTKYPADKTEKMKAALKKAIGLNPDFAESYRLLSFIYMVNEENPDEALAYIKKGGELQPGNPEFSLLLAQIYSQKNKFAEAKQIAQNLVETADELNMRNRADFTLKNIEQREK
jgi:tetratricopeptide (TPR) repeat protein